MATNPFLALGGGQGQLPQVQLGQALAPTLPAQPIAPPLYVPPPIPAVQPDPPISKLRPGSEQHAKVLAKLKALRNFGRDEMKKHYSRWNFGEQRIQAYVRCQEYDELMEYLTNSKTGMPPEPIQVIVPYSYATLHAAATFIATVLLGRKPIFPLLAARGTTVDAAGRMEQALQYNVDASRGMEQLWQLIWDSLIYGFGVTRNSWETRYGPVIRWAGDQRVMSNELQFAGNVINCVDPYAFYPDPRVPIHECNQKGDFIFTQISLSNTILRDMEKSGAFTWVKEGLEKNTNRTMDADDASTENRRRLKIGMGGELLSTPKDVTGFSKVFDGTVRLVAKDWGLGDKEESELWKFAFLENQIIQAEPLGMVHQMHPYTATEPASFGHDFMSVSMADMIGPFQDILSWLVSSRMENVRVAINNMFVADPARVEINDIRSSAIGRVIRLKQAAIGTPINQIIQQLDVADVTGGHLADIQTMRVLADTITGVNDNMRGIQTAGGRRSATEARMSMQAGASRLQQMAVRISTQAFHPMAQQMIYNLQQFMPRDMWLEVTGDDRSVEGERVTPDMLVGNFNFQISDGSLPFDKTALVEVWKEILFGIGRDPELRQTYDMGKIFNYTAELGGARNISSFKRSPQELMQLRAAMNPGAQPGMQPVGAAQPAAPMLASGVNFG